MAKRNAGGVALAVGIGALAVVLASRQPASVAAPAAVPPPLADLAKVFSGPSYTRPGWFSDGEASGASNVTHSILFVPVYFAGGRTYDGIGAQVHLSAPAGARARMGIYAAALTPTGLAPGKLTIDAGTMPVDESGVQMAPFAFTPPTGYAFLAMVYDGAATYFGPDNSFNVVPPVSGRSDPIDWNQHNLVVMATAPDAAANWVANGLPADAPPITYASTAGLAIPFLREP